MHISSKHKQTKFLQTTNFFTHLNYFQSDKCTKHNGIAWFAVSNPTKRMTQWRPLNWICDFQSHFCALLFAFLAIIKQEMLSLLLYLEAATIFCSNASDKNLQNEDTRYGFHWYSLMYLVSTFSTDGLWYRWGSIFFICWCLNSLLIYPNGLYYHVNFAYLRKNRIWLKTLHIRRW